MIHKSAESHRADIEKAYAAWSKKTDIKFIEGYKPYRTVVIIGSKKAYAPRERVVGLYFINKRIVIFDQSNFYNIVLHEIGHSIGLPHNKDYFDIMYPTTDGLNLITPTSLLDLIKVMNERDYLFFY